MKFYNPFKLHIAQRQNGKYVLRVSSVFFWSYHDRKSASTYYWSEPLHVSRYCEFDTLDEARKVLARIEAAKDNRSYFVE